MDEEKVGTGTIEAIRRKEQVARDFASFYTVQHTTIEMASQSLATNF